VAAQKTVAFWQQATISSADRSSDDRVDHTAVSGDSDCKSQN